MSHIDQEELALIALGEPVGSSAAETHLHQCAQCRNELAEMTHAVIVGRAAMDDQQMEAPAARVWKEIHTRLGLSDAVHDDPLSTPEPVNIPDAGTARTAGTADSAVSAREVSIRPRRARGHRMLWTLAASLAVLAGVGGAIWAGTTASLAPVSVASATLDAFPDHPQAAGEAEVDEQPDGSRELTVTVNVDETADTYREVWLIRNDGQALISLGVLSGRSGTFRIPNGVDLSDYDLVDISFEPIDGDPAHSGDSIVRGALEFV